MVNEGDPSIFKHINEHVYELNERIIVSSLQGSQVVAIGSLPLPGSSKEPVATIPYPCRGSYSSSDYCSSVTTCHMCQL
jgi:hypothetical protein